MRSVMLPISGSGLTCSTNDISDVLSGPGGTDLYEHSPLMILITGRAPSMVFQNDILYVKNLPNCRHGNEGPPKALPNTGEERRWEVYRVRRSVLVGLRNKKKLIIKVIL